jgi:hypothetical protein
MRVGSASKILRRSVIRPAKKDGPRTGLNVRVAAALLLLAVLLLAAACAQEAVSTSEGTSPTDVTVPATNQGTSPTDVTVPPPDSPATAIYQALGWGSVYVVYRLEIENGWAYVHAIPFTTTDGPTIDTRALLRQTAGGGWEVLEVFRNEGLLTDVGQVAEDQAIPDQLKSKYSDAPAGIFPQVRPQDRLMMDAVRTALGGPDYFFNVFVLSEDQGWAYTELRALRYQQGRIIESREERALLQERKGTWTVLQMRSSTGTLQTEFVAFLKKQYPDLPASILP